MVVLEKSLIVTNMMSWDIKTAQAGTFEACTCVGRCIVFEWTAREFTTFVVVFIYNIYKYKASKID